MKTLTYSSLKLEARTPNRLAENDIKILRTAAKRVKNLITLGRYKEAEKVCNVLASILKLRTQ